MWRNPSAVSLAAVRRRVPAVAIAFATVTALAVLDAVSGHEMAVLGTLTAGPGIAAGSGRPRAVLAVGIYGLVLINVLSWWPDGTWGSSQHLLYTGVATAMTAVGVGIAVQIRAAQHALLEAEGHWRTLAAVVTHSDDAIVAAGLDGRLTAFNAGAERLYGRRAEDMVGTSLAEFDGGAMPEAARGPSPAEVLSRIAAGEKGIRFETVRGHKDGGFKDVSVVISPVYDERGTVVGVSSVARDISAQKRAEERSQQTQRMASLGPARRRRRARLQQPARHHAQLHRLRRGVGRRPGGAFRPGQGAAGRRTRRRTDPPVADLHPPEHRATAQPGRERLHRRGARHAGAHHRGEHPARRQAVGAAVDDQRRPRADPAGPGQPGGQRPGLDARRRHPDHRGDRDRTRRPPGRPAPGAGRRPLRAAAGQRHRMWDERGGRVAGVRAVLHDQTQGPRYGPRAGHRVRHHRRGRRQHQRLLRAGHRHHRPGVLPAGDRRPGADLRRPVAAPPGGHGRTVLVVEDEQALGEAVARILNDGGYRTLSAGDGAHALRLDLEQGCDLLLTDVIMPEMSGRRLAETMLERHPGLPVLYMSGYSDGLLGHEHILDDEIAFIEKPFTSAHLLSRVGAMLLAVPALAHGAVRQTGNSD